MAKRVADTRNGGERGGAVSKVMDWIFDEHLDAVMIAIVCFVLGIVFLALINTWTNPDYCDQACRQARYLSSVVQECEKLDIYTRDECITMAGAIR